jgi:hypothetical protein
MVEKKLRNKVMKYLCSNQYDIGTYYHYDEMIIALI